MTGVVSPISIALVGAPASGKQRVIEELKKIADPWFVNHTGENLEVVPNPGNDIVRDLDQAVGLFGSWKEDLRIFFRRYEQEQYFQREAASYVTSGTTLECIAHCGVNMENIMKGIQTEEQQQKIQIQQLTMSQLTHLFFNTFRYSFAFRLDRPLGVVLPDSVDSEENYNRRIGDALDMVMGSFGLRMQVIRGSAEDQAGQIFDALHNFVENDPAEPDSPAPSGESGTLSE